MIPFKSKLRGIKDIGKRNAAFSTLTEEDQRKEIAFDGLNLVMKGVATSSEVGYWEGGLDDLRFDGRYQEAAALQKILVESTPDCRVCQRGLLMVSQIRLSNSIGCDDFNVCCGSPDNIKGFSMESFDIMERVYEHANGQYRNLDAEYAGWPYKHNTKHTLANICCNVIANGDFNIKDKTDYLEKWGIKLNRKQAVA